MVIIPLRPIPAQTVKTVLSGQNCQLRVYYKPQGIFVDVAVGGVDAVTCVVARNAVPIVCREYSGFAGNLLFFDMQGRLDPQYSGFGSRYLLVYMTTEEYGLIK